jgi:hypothetical protein
MEVKAMIQAFFTGFLIGAAFSMWAAGIYLIYQQEKKRKLRRHFNG